MVDCVLSMYRALGFATGGEKEWILEVKLKEERETEERGKGGREGSREGGRSDLLFCLSHIRIPESFHFKDSALLSGLCQLGGTLGWAGWA